MEYKLEGYNLFLEMMANIRRNTIYNVYMFQPAKVTLTPILPHALSIHCVLIAPQAPSAGTQLQQRVCLEGCAELNIHEHIWSSGNLGCQC